MPNIDFDRAKTERLRRDYKRALAEHKDKFNFEGIPLLTDYAKYLLEYLDGKFNKEPPHK